MENNSLDLVLTGTGLTLLTLGVGSAVEIARDLPAGLPDSYGLAPVIGAIVAGGMIVSPAIHNLYSRWRQYSARSSYIKSLKSPRRKATWQTKHNK